MPTPVIAGSSPHEFQDGDQLIGRPLHPCTLSSVLIAPPI